jgi:hypothetical protein
MKLEGVRSIYLLDIALGISRLPFKMTIGAMLKASRVAISSRSFKKASEHLFEECKMKIDAKTVMEVTRLIGNIAFDHELKYAKNCYKLLEDGKLIFPEKKQQSIFYVAVDGTTVLTREKETDSKWRESIVGLVFDSKEMSVLGKNMKREKDQK